MADEPLGSSSSLAAAIVSAYVSNNEVDHVALASLIVSTHKALTTLGKPTAEPETPKADKAAVKRSLQGDHLTSFLDGRPYKSLKRHLRTHGITPKEYRAKFGLSDDYPMVAPSYSAKRSALAKSLGLGRKIAPLHEPAIDAERGRGRPPKAIKNTKRTSS